MTKFGLSANTLEIIIEAFSSLSSEIIIQFEPNNIVIYALESGNVCLGICKLKASELEIFSMSTDKVCSVSSKILLRLIKDLIKRFIGDTKKEDMQITLALVDNGYKEYLEVKRDDIVFELKTLATDLVHDYPPEPTENDTINYVFRMNTTKFRDMIAMGSHYSDKVLISASAPQKVFVDINGDLVNAYYEMEGLVKANSSQLYSLRYIGFICIAVDLSEHVKITVYDGTSVMQVELAFKEGKILFYLAPYETPDGECKPERASKRTKLSL